MKRARALVEADSLRLWLVDDEQLRLAASAGTDAPFVDGEHALDRFLSGGSLRSPGPIAITTASRDRIADPSQFGRGGAGGALVVPLVFRGRGFGVLAAFDQLGDRAFTSDDELALRSFAASAATAVATARSVEAQRLRDTIHAAEDERRRFARDLHDQTLQGLGAIKLALRLSLRGTPEAGRTAVESTLDQLDLEILALRGIITDLRPPSLDELGLEPAIRSLAVRLAEAHEFVLSLELGLGDRRLDPEVETIAYRIVQESLTNVIKHAQATNVSVSLSAGLESLVVSVTDDGLGFACEAGGRVGGYGLVGMHERAEIGGGALVVDSAPGRGTAVTVSARLL